MNTEPHDLILDHLRHLRSQMDDVQRKVTDLRDGSIAQKDEGVRRDRAIAWLEDEVARIKTRLDISD